jgi:hypothetical protein
MIDETSRRIRQENAVESRKSEKGIISKCCRSSECEQDDPKSVS